MTTTMKTTEYDDDYDDEDDEDERDRPFFRKRKKKDVNPDSQRRSCGF